MEDMYLLAQQNDRRYGMPTFVGNVLVPLVSLMFRRTSDPTRFHTTDTPMPADSTHPGGTVLPFRAVERVNRLS
jgi:hypothetical protein